MDLSRTRLHLHMLSSAALCFPSKSSSRMQNRPFIFKILYLSRVLAPKGTKGANLFGFDPARDKFNGAPSALLHRRSTTCDHITLSLRRSNFLLWNPLHREGIGIPAFLSLSNIIAIIERESSLFYTRAAIADRADLSLFLFNPKCEIPEG